MWDFKISYIGSAAAIFIIILSLFTEWVYMANVRYKYQKIKIYSKNTPIKNSKNIFHQKNINVYFKRGQNFFNKNINFSKRIIRFEDRAFFNNSIYENINSVFLTYKYCQFLQKHKFALNLSYVAKILLSVLAINFIWTLFIGLWIIVSILGLFYLFFSVLIVFINKKIDAKSATYSLEYLKNILDKNEYMWAKKYIKYKKNESIILIFKLFTVPLIDLIKIIKIWGHDNE